MKFTQTLAVHLRLSDQDTTGNHRYILLLPIDLNLRADESDNGFSIVFRTHHQHLIAHVEDCITIGDAYVSILKNTRNDEIASHKILDLQQCLSVQGFIMHFQMHTIRGEMRVGRLLLDQLFFLLLQVDATKQAHQDDGTDDAQHTQRIGTSIPHRYLRTIVAQLRQGFVGRTKPRCIGHGTTKDTYHHREFHASAQAIIEGQCYRDIQQDDTYRHHVHRHAPFLERSEERRSYLETDAEDKENQPEVLHKVQNLRIAGKAEVSAHDTGKQDESHTKRYAKKLDFTQKHTHRYDKCIEQNNVCDGIYICKQRL